MNYVFLLIIFSFAVYGFSELRKGNILMPIWIVYLSFEVGMSLLASTFIGDLTHYKFVFSESYIYVFVVSVLSIIIGNISSNRIRYINIAKADLRLRLNLKSIDRWILINFFLFAVIAIKVYFVFIQSSNEFGIRSELNSLMSGIEFVIYKLGFVIVALIAFKHSLSKRTFLSYLLLLTILYSYFMYGGRFLIFTNIFLYIIILKFPKIIKIRKVNAWIVSFSLIIYLGISIFFANTRYYMNNGDTFSSTFTKDKYLSTAFMQLGGNWLDFSRVESSSAAIDLGDNFFPTILEGFLPSSLRDAFFSEFFKKRIAFGSYFANKIDEEDNALRLNFTNEIYFSFGYLGVIIYSLTIGYLFAVFQKFLKGPLYPIPIFFFTQFLSLHILGSNTFSNTLLLTLFFMFMLKQIVGNSKLNKIQDS